MEKSNGPKRACAPTPQGRARAPRGTPRAPSAGMRRGARRTPTVRAKSGRARPREPCVPVFWRERSGSAKRRVDVRNAQRSPFDSQFLLAFQVQNQPSFEAAYSNTTSHSQPSSDRPRGELLPYTTQERHLMSDGPNGAAANTNDGVTRSDNDTNNNEYVPLLVHLRRNDRAPRPRPAAALRRVPGHCARFRAPPWPELRVSPRTLTAVGLAPVRARPPHRCLCGKSRLLTRVPTPSPILCAARPPRWSRVPSTSLRTSATR